MTFQSPQPGLEPINYHSGIEVLEDPVERDTIQPLSRLVEVDGERAPSQSRPYQPQQWASTASAGYLNQSSEAEYVPTKAELPVTRKLSTDSATLQRPNGKKRYLTRTLWCLVITALIILILGSVGGGVAGGLLKHRHQNLNASQSSPTNPQDSEAITGTAVLSTRSGVTSVSPLTLVLTLGSSFITVTTTVKPSESTHASDSTNSAEGSAQEATAARVATSTNTQSRSAPDPSPSSSTGPGGVTIECPDVNNTVYPSNGLRFLRQCGINYGAADGAIDLRNLDASNMEECIGYCAQYSGLNKCIGATWVYVGPQGTAFNYCWLKSKTGMMVATYFDSMESALLM